VSVEVLLSAGGAVGGRLVGPEERPAAGSVTVQELDGREAPAALAQVLRAEAGADGRFRVAGVPAGSHALGVRAPGLAAQRVIFDLGPTTLEVDLGDVALEVGLTISGRVRDRAGLPVSGARIDMFPRSPTAISFRGDPVECAADGRFVAAGLSPGIHSLTASASGYGRVTKELEAGATGVELVLPPAAAIVGQVVDERGRAVEAFDVEAEPAKQGLGSTWGHARGDQGDGRFRVQDMNEGTYVLSVTAPEFAATTVSDVKVVGGSETDVGRIRLRRGGSVRGIVTDAEGLGIPGATVTVTGTGEPWMRSRHPEAVSGPGGSFDVSGIAPGAAIVVAQHAEYAEGRSPAIDVDPAKGPVDVRLVLTRGGRIEGWARRRDGAGFEGFVSILPASSEAFFHTEALYRIPIRPDGSFAADHVPAGAANVRLMQGGTRATSVASRTVEVREGETTSVELLVQDILVNGLVTRNGAPAAGVRLRFWGRSAGFSMSAGTGLVGQASGPQRNAAVTAPDGRYELLVSEPGTYRVGVDAPDGRSFVWLRPVEIPDVEVHTVDLALAGSPVAGVVVDKETGEPISEAWVSLSRKATTGPGSSARGQTGPDGRFQMEAEDGDYEIAATATGYGPYRGRVAVPASGELRLTLAKGLVVAGTVVDAFGKPAGAIEINAAWGGDPDSVSSAGAYTKADGRFRFDSLTPAPVTLFAGSSTAGFAVKPGVRPGGPDVVLALTPGGRVEVRVLDAEGRPVEGAWVWPSRVGGSLVESMVSGQTAAGGRIEIAVPLGNIELYANQDDFEGRTSVTVREGETASAEIRLGPKPRAGGD
jgi:5-hydroxyisourate hydrolase-like protein (transthyretin family)